MNYIETCRVLEFKVFALISFVVKEKNRFLQVTLDPQPDHDFQA